MHLNGFKYHCLCSNVTLFMKGLLLPTSVIGHCVLSSWRWARRCRFSSLQDLSMLYLAVRLLIALCITQREAQISRVVCLWFIFWAIKGFWFDVSWGSWPWASVDFMYVFLCFIFLSRCYFSEVLLFFWLSQKIHVYTGSKNPQEIDLFT